MEIDLDAGKPSLPPWNLTVKHQGQIYPVRQPTGGQLVKLMELKQGPTSEKYAYLLELFQELTGISDQITPDDMQRFFTGLALQIGKRFEKHHIAG